MTCTALNRFSIDLHCFLKICVDVHVFFRCSKMFLDVMSILIDFACLGRFAAENFWEEAAKPATFSWNLTLFFHSLVIEDACGVSSPHPQTFCLEFRVAFGQALSAWAEPAWTCRVCKQCIDFASGRLHGEFHFWSILNRHVFFTFSIFSLFFFPQKRKADKETK